MKRKNSWKKMAYFGKKRKKKQIDSGGGGMISDIPGPTPIKAKIKNNKKK